MHNHHYSAHIKTGRKREGAAIATKRKSKPAPGAATRPPARLVRPWYAPPFGKIPARIMRRLSALLVRHKSPDSETVLDRARELAARSKVAHPAPGSEGAIALVRKELDRLDRDIAQFADPASRIMPRKLWLEASIRLASREGDMKTALAMADQHHLFLNVASTALALQAAGKLHEYAAEGRLIEKLHSIARPSLFHSKSETYRKRAASMSQAYYVLLRRFILTRNSNDWSDLKATATHLDRYAFDEELRTLCGALWDQLAEKPRGGDQDLLLERAIFTFATACDQAGFANAFRTAEASMPQWAHERRFRAGLFAMLRDYIRYTHAGGVKPPTALPLEDERLFQAYVNGPQLGCLRSSSVLRALHAGEIAARALKQSSKLHTGVMRLSLSSMNTNFLLPLYERLRSDERFHAAFTDFRPVLNLYQADNRLDELYTPFDRISSPAFKELLLGHSHARELFTADTVLYDFVDRGAVWASWNLPVHTKLFFRLHAYEAYSPTIHLVNWGSVNGVIFVASHIRQFVLSQLGERLAAVPQIVLPNFTDASELNLARLSRGNREGQRTVLGMAGAFSIRKQPAMALKILQELRREGGHWSLRFAGAYWDGTEQGEEARYRAEFEALLKECGDAVHLDGFQHDIAQWYGRVDYILSCSIREGTHEAIAEGMLAGAVPIVRNWPNTAPFGGPGSVYPVLGQLGLIFSDVHDAAATIRSVCKDYLRYQRATSESAMRELDAGARYEELVKFLHLH